MQAICITSLIESRPSRSEFMNEVAEARRGALFRTEYRVVESEVDGLLVKW
jgi:hypothetical protein